MKVALLIAGAVLALAPVAQAATYNLEDGLTLTLSTTLPSNTFAPTPSTFTLGKFLQSVSGDQTSGGNIIAKSPFSDGRPFDAVLGGGSATFASVAEEEGEDRRRGRGADDVIFASSFGSGQGTFSFIWGTPDTYNSLVFETDSGEKTLSGAQSALSGVFNGQGSYYATVGGLGTYFSTKFVSDPSNSFEFAGVSAVPLPASAPMFGAALVALGLAGYGLKRKKAAASV